LDAFVGFKILLLNIRRIIVNPSDGISAQRNHDRAGEQSDACRAFDAIDRPVQDRASLFPQIEGKKRHKSHDYDAVSRLKGHKSGLDAVYIPASFEKDSL
jgi:hypothetical protein